MLSVQGFAVAGCGGGVLELWGIVWNCGKKSGRRSI